MAIIGIVAVDRNGAIGRGGTLPWHYSADMKHFKQQTLGHACVMGRRTWLSLKRPLKERLNIVLSRSSQIEPQPSVITLRNQGAVLALKPYLACDIFVIGGAEVFRAFRDDIERWIVTEVPLVVEDADTFMPADYLQGFGPVDSLSLEENLRVTVYERSR
ncbi:MAG TPA: dihydrofolate reductase [Pyrinomonadaceae bacterium]|jgi:dihydrofolate reductase